MNRIIEVDIPNARIVVEPGVLNAHVTQEVAPYGYFYAPDPSSQSVCTIGGNVAENSGGAHCLKHGFTTTLPARSAKVVMCGVSARVAASLLQLVPSFTSIFLLTPD
jgi:hypothetical protein